MCIAGSRVDGTLAVRIVHCDGGCDGRWMSGGRVESQLFNTIALYLSIER